MRSAFWGQAAAGYLSRLATGNHHPQTLCVRARVRARARACVWVCQKEREREGGRERETWSSVVVACRLSFAVSLQVIPVEMHERVDHNPSSGDCAARSKC